MGRSMRTAGAQARGRVWLCTLVTAVWGGVAAAAPPRAMSAAAPAPTATSATIASAPVSETLDGTTLTRRDYAATLSANQTVSIDNPYGDVHVRFGGFEHRVEVHAVFQQPQEAAPLALAPAADGADYRIAARPPEGAPLHEGQRVDLSVLLPEGHALRVRTQRGAIDVRGVRAAVDLLSIDGDITLRGIRGAIQAQTGAGAIEAALASAPRGSRQRLATSTGDIRLGVDDGLDALLEMATSNQFATDYSLRVERRPGQEPNKLARAVVGRDRARIRVESARGEIRLLRRASYIVAGKGAPAATAEAEDNDSD